MTLKAKTEQPPETNAPPPLPTPNPTEGGSYIRQPDGSLVRQPDEAPVKED